MKNLLIALLCLFSHLLFAHSGNEGHQNLREWSISSENQNVKASLMMLKDKTVYLENDQHRVMKVLLSSLSANDQSFVVQKYQQIEASNTTPSVSKGKNGQNLLENNFWLLVWFSTLLTSFLLVRSYQNRFKFKYGYALTLIIMLGFFASFMPKPVLGTDPLFIDSAFIPFKPKVKTHWDTKYFYVEDLGMPSHRMMNGITAWQQQVPIPQCYVGTNAWSIPLNPVIAATPTPTRTNFFKGAVALAANGIPIFNALNNRGEDSYLIGELDQYGGHCGRADDYHYHIAPLSLDSINTDILPIAFALDGFAVYAAKEPNGTAMTALDANHGHTYNNVYHYHGTTNYPYVVGNMVGVVTKDSTDQIIPQAQTKPVRPAGTPLAGAVITNHELTGTNAYKLTYTVNNQTYFVNYSWTNNAVYTFSWGSPTGTTNATYNGQNCTLPTGVNDVLMDDSHIKIFPNPTKTGFSLDLSSPYNVNDIKSISVYDAQGHLMQKVDKYKSFIETPYYNEGVYFVKIQFATSELTKRLVVQSK